MIKNKRLRPGVKALIVHEGKVLMVHERQVRRGKPVVITDFPGGGMDFGEGFDEALIREVKEEIGLDIKVGKIVGAWGFVIEDEDHEQPENSAVHIICIGYQCEVVGSINIDTTKNPAEEDIFDITWYSREELLENDGKLLRAKDMIEAVKNLDI